MVQQAGGQRSAPRSGPGRPDIRAYLRDYAALLESTPFPSVVHDHRWDVVLANSAYEELFAEVGPHPTAMPGENLLRFVLFHPDAARVLGEHESSWCLPMLADFASAVERHGHDRVLQAIRREIAQDPIMDVAYRHGVPHWLRAVGQDAGEPDGAVRPLRHPDPRWGGVCRVVGETPRTLREVGYARVTLVLREAGAAGPGRGGHHLRVVPPTAP
ncbi:hypothetical protein [Streptomyces griseoaurantiacus]|uniref:MmyB family transcriptional regulator n=1 Tax=Streptomyces TaxID=1883 RepID=UPI0030DE3738